MGSQIDLNASVNLWLGPQPITGACNLTGVMLLSLVESTQPWVLAPASRVTVGLLCPYAALSFVFSFLVPCTCLALFFYCFYLYLLPHNIDISVIRYVSFMIISLIISHFFYEKSIVGFDSGGQIHSGFLSVKENLEG